MDYTNTVNIITVSRQIQHTIKTAPNSDITCLTDNETLTVLKLARNANSDGLINYLIPLARDSMSSDRMKLLSCFANQNVVGPRLPFATRTFYLSIQKSMREEFYLLIKSCTTRTVTATEKKSIGLQADAQLSWFLQHHLDNFILT